MKALNCFLVIQRQMTLKVYSIWNFIGHATDEHFVSW